jgi:phytol kinase
MRVSPAVGLVAVPVALTALLLAGKCAQSCGRLAPEPARKLVHVGMGTVCLAFPWLFESAWPAWVLAALAIGMLVALRTWRVLRRTVGGVLHEVERASWGELYFPLAVATVFTLAAGDWVKFFVPVALLTFADAAGALVGERWGRRHYVTLEGRKSLEGSLAVAGVAWLVTTLPLALAGRGAAEAVAIGAAVGAFAAIVEAISWRGLDNLFLPLAAYAQLAVYLALPLGEVALRLGVLLACGGAALWWRRGHLADDSARLGAALALYFFWAIGGGSWLVAPLLFLLSYVRLMPAVPGGNPRHNLVAVICVGSAGLGWAVAEAIVPAGPWLWPFTVGLATHQAVVAIVRWSQTRPSWGRGRCWTVGLTTALTVQLGAFALLDRGTIVGLAPWLGGAGIISLAAAGFVLAERELQLPRDLGARWWRQGLAAGLASVAAWLILRP